MYSCSPWDCENTLILDQLQVNSAGTTKLVIHFFVMSTDPGRDNLTLMAMALVPT
eukprot:SAG31_NODE_36648_length_311_cov_1.004717_1_plen_54_part_10